MNVCTDYYVNEARLLEDWSTYRVRFVLRDRGEIVVPVPAKSRNEAMLAACREKRTLRAGEVIKVTVSS